MSTSEERKEIYTTTRWRKLRHRKLDLNPLCEHCQAQGLTVAAEIVHHIVPVSEGGDPFPDIAGLESICTSCHSLHHNTMPMTEEQKKFQALIERLDEY